MPSNGPFYAYLNLSANGLNPQRNLILNFSTAAKAKQWHDLLISTSWPGGLQMSKETIKRPQLQWFTWPSSKGSSEELVNAITKNDSMKAVKGEWGWKDVSDSEKPVIPSQDENGKVTESAEAKQKIADLEAKLAKAHKGNNTNANDGGGDDDDDKDIVWNNAVEYASYPKTKAMVDDGIRLAKYMKDLGDDRTFSMVFSHLNMEQRRVVGVARKLDPEGGYDSWDLMKLLVERTAEMKEKGDKRSWAMVLSMLSMEMRRAMW